MTSCSKKCSCTSLMMSNRLYVFLNLDLSTGMLKFNNGYSANSADENGKTIVVGRKSFMALIKVWSRLSFEHTLSRLASKLGSPTIWSRRSTKWKEILLEARFLWSRWTLRDSAWNLNFESILRLVSLNIVDVPLISVPHKIKTFGESTLLTRRESISGVKCEYQFFPYPLCAFFSDPIPEDVAPLFFSSKK